MMKNYMGDQTQVAGFYESGAYGTQTGSGSPFWFGMVQNHEPDEGMGVIDIRYAGAASRNAGRFQNGPTEYTGTLEFFPQNFRMLKFALGHCADNGSPSPYSHTYTEANSDSIIPELSGTSATLPSFQIEDAHVTSTGKNDVRTFKGCVTNTFSMSISEGEPVSCSVEYRAQDVDFSSGAKSSVTASTIRPFMWSDVRVDIPSGTQYSNVKELNPSINNNLQAPNYVDSSRDIGVPLPTNRDYEVGLTLNANDSKTKTLYDQYYLAGSTFNMQVYASVSAGSRDLTLTCSGCKITDFGNPTPNEGVIEQSITVRPESVSAVENSSDHYYNLGSYAGS